MFSPHFFTVTDLRRPRTKVLEDSFVLPADLRLRRIGQHHRSRANVVEHPRPGHHPQPGQRVIRPGDQGRQLALPLLWHVEGHIQVRNVFNPYPFHRKS